MSQNAFSAASATATLVVAPVNDRPVLATGGTLTLPPIAESVPSPSGTTVSSLLSDIVFDPDSSLLGIAVTGVTGKGTWQFSTSAGATWVPVGGVSVTGALLLPAAAQIRFVALAGLKGTAALYFNIWDASTGTPGSRSNTKVGTAFSLATEVVFEVVGNGAPSL
jgi:hypothetical protein